MTYGCKYAIFTNKHKATLFLFNWDNIAYFFVHFKNKRKMKVSKEAKEKIVVDILNLLKENVGEDNLGLNAIIDYLPFFKKEILKYVIDPILLIDDSFEVVDAFEMKVSEEKKYKVTFVQITKDISSEWCVKRIKILSYPTKTLFLGNEGLEKLQYLFPDKIKGKKIISFASKTSNNAKYIPGLKTNAQGNFERTLSDFISIISKGTIIAVFSLIEEK